MTQRDKLWAGLMTPALALAIPLIQRFEGCILHPYRCPAGVWTIGYGCTTINDKPVSADTPPITQGSADTLLLTQATIAADQVAKLAGALPDHQAAALISFVFNLGEGKLARSTLLIKLRAGDIAGAADEFPKWNLSGGRALPGLVARRAAERALFLRDA